VGSRPGRRGFSTHCAPLCRWGLHINVTFHGTARTHLVFPASSTCHHSLPYFRYKRYPIKLKYKKRDQIVLAFGFHDATRLATLHNSAMHWPLTPIHKGTVYWRI
jgi:hypothetical protein